MNRPSNMSQLDYLWTTFGDKKLAGDGPNDLVTVGLLNKQIEELKNKGITKLVLDSNLKGLNESGEEITSVELNELISFDKVIFEGKDCYKLTFKNGDVFYAPIDNYVGSESNTINTSIINNQIIANLKIAKHEVQPAIDIKKSKDGIYAELRIDEESKTNVRIKAEDGKGISASYCLEDGTEINHEVLTSNDYLLLDKIDNGTFYWLTDLGKIMFRGKNYSGALEKNSVEYTKEDGKKYIILKEDDSIVNSQKLNLISAKGIGNTQNPLNLNGSEERPVYNDTHEIAYVEDVQTLQQTVKDLQDVVKKLTMNSSDYSATVTKELKSGGEVTLYKDVFVEKDGLTLTKDTTIDLNSYELNTHGATYGDSLTIGNGANIVIKNGTIPPAETESVVNNSATIMLKTSVPTTLTLENVDVSGIHPLYLLNAAEGTKATIKSGNYTCTGENGEAVFVQKGGKVIIEGGYFSNPNATKYKGFLLNIKDDFRGDKDPREFIEVRGGTFVDFDPSNNGAEGAGTNFVAEGYSVVSEVGLEHTLYKVIKN